MTKFGILGYRTLKLLLYLCTCVVAIDEVLLSSDNSRFSLNIKRTYNIFFKLLRIRKSNILLKGMKQLSYAYKKRECSWSWTEKLSQFYQPIFYTRNWIYYCIYLEVLVTYNGVLLTPPLYFEYCVVSGNHRFDLWCKYSSQTDRATI